MLDNSESWALRVKGDVTKKTVHELRYYIVYIVKTELGLTVQPRIPQSEVSNSYIFNNLFCLFI